MAVISETALTPDEIVEKRSRPKKYQEIYDALAAVPPGKVYCITLEQAWERRQIESAVRHWSGRIGRFRCNLRFPPVVDPRLPYRSFYVLLTPKLEGK